MKTTNKEGQLVRNPEKCTRFIDFSGFNKSERMSSGSVYASDIDCIQEFNNRVLIITEIKEDGMDIRTGQRLLLERLADAWVSSGEDKVAIVLFATHSPSLGSKIPVGECVVKKTYVGCRGAWKPAIPRIGLIDALHMIGDKYNVKKLKKQ